MPPKSLNPEFDRDLVATGKGRMNNLATTGNQGSTRVDEVFSRPFSKTMHEAEKATRFGEFV